MNRWLAIGVVLILVLWATVGSNLERLVNRPAPRPRTAVSDSARALHNASWVADLHSDSLMFGRDLLRRSEVGHVDLPRLVDGGVAFQVFSAPTKAPWNQNFERTDGNAFDAFTLAGILQLSHLAYGGPLARAERMAADLDRMARASAGELVVIRTRADLTALRIRQARGDAVVGSLLAIEGAHAAESSRQGLQRLVAAGYRMIGLTHFFDNDYGGSAHGIAKGGLSRLGRDTIDQMERLGVILDLAHLAPAAIDDALARVSKPVVVSHGGTKRTCDNLRTLSDDHVRGIAATGGVVGVAYFEGAVCGNTPQAVAEAIRALVDLVGDRHVALGSDFDGGIAAGFDTRDLVHVTQALLDVGLSPVSIERVLGANFQRVLEQTLP